MPLVVSRTSTRCSSSVKNTSACPPSWKSPPDFTIGWTTIVLKVPAGTLICSLRRTFRTTGFLSSRKYYGRVIHADDLHGSAPHGEAPRRTS